MMRRGALGKTEFSELGRIREGGTKNSAYPWAVKNSCIHDCCTLKLVGARLEAVSIRDPE